MHTRGFFFKLYDFKFKDGKVSYSVPYSEIPIPNVIESNNFKRLNIVYDSLTISEDIGNTLGVS